MVLVKSFFKKSRTKIYLLCLISIFTLLFFSKQFLKIYNTKFNSYYSDSYLEFISSKNDFEDIINTPNIKLITIGATIKTNEQTITVFPNVDLKDNEIIISSYYQYKIGDIVKIKDKEFIVKNIILGKDESYLNQKVFEEVIRNESKLIYRLSLDNWSKLMRTRKALRNVNVYSYDIINNPLEILPKINFLTIFKRIEIRLTIIILFISFLIIYSCFYNEHKSNFIFHNIGFSKVSRELIIILNIFLIFATSMLVSLGLSTLIKVIFNII